MRLSKKASKMYKENSNVAVKVIANGCGMVIHDINEEYVIWSMSYSEFCYKSKLRYTKDERITFRGFGYTHDIDDFERIYSI